MLVPTSWLSAPSTSGVYSQSSLLVAPLFSLFWVLPLAIAVLSCCSVALLFCLPGIWTPAFARSTLLNGLAFRATVAALLTAIFAWLVSEVVQNASDTDGDGTIDEFEARAGQILFIPVPVLRLINIVLAVALTGGHAALLIVSFLQVDLGYEWNGMTGATGVVTGLLLFIAAMFNGRGLLMTAAVLSLFLVDVYATWFKAPTY